MKILLLVTSSIAIVKLGDFLNLLKKDSKNQITVVLSKNASKYKLNFPKEDQNLKYLYSESYIKKDPQHVYLARDNDLIILFAATYNTITKFARGIADNFLTSILAVNKKPVVILPAMNSNMWENPINLEHVSKLKKYGHIFIGPDCGTLYCNDFGIGKMAKVSDIYERLFGKNKPKLLLSFGYTKSPIDSVRSLMVPSSGKMGLALISELAFDFDLTVINASLQHLNSKIPANVKVVNVNYIDEYKEAVFSEIKNSDGFISVAAVSDFIFEKIDNKISKNNSSGVLKYHIGSDVLKEVSNKYPNKIMVGFSLGDSNNYKEKAKEKLINKKLSLIVANSTSSLNNKNINASLFDKNLNEIYFENVSKYDFAKEIKNQLWKIIKAK